MGIDSVEILRCNFMKQKEINFSPAIWISAGGEYPAPLFRKRFFAEDIKKAKLLIGCFGMFEGFLNEKPISDEKYGTLNTDFHRRDAMTYCDVPFAEDLEHRLYCPEYDATDLLSEGENTLCFQLGSGWYERGDDTGFGHVKLCFRLSITHSDGSESVICSDKTVKRHKSMLTECDLIIGETQDFTDFPDNWMKKDFSDDAWENAICENAPDTRYLLQDCPGDRVIRTLKPKLLSEKDGKQIYDAGEMMTGYPVFCTPGKKQEIRVRFGELLDADGNLDENKIYNQHMIFFTDGKPRTLRTFFTWFCFRYFEVCGDCEVSDCLVIHSDVAVSSAFSSDIPVLNWIYDAYLRTQLANMHGGIPSDCPHTERRGYTGDGQLVCHAAMTYLDAQKFFKKWIYDIADCQDRKTGHVQYTAPFLPSGGGPGGWGCAIVNVPYQYYRRYRDKSVLEDLYPQMLFYFEYLENHSENDLVVSDRENAWCLGDWCTPEQATLNLFSGILIPNPFVNTYFYIKSMKQVLEISEVLGISKDREMLKERIAKKEAALVREYFDSATGNFCGNKQGADAYAVDLGLGDERTLSNMVSHYRKIGHYDTGIFGTDIVTRVLFEKGFGDVAASLLTSQNPISFYNEMKLGATTILEYWTGERSQCHPMFGAASVYLSEYILGIRMAEGLSADSVIIAPAAMDQVSKASGYITTRFGKISVSYDEKTASVTLPEGTDAKIHIPGKEVTITRT